ncbi:MAG: hypothetical protein KatS3mg105_1594 [Gemmatales bacterium]|nr:MAG: hypothetical protein KatS3mg105_1594 [Gemmatales bacterium]
MATIWKSALRPIADFCRPRPNQKRTKSTPRSIVHIAEIIDRCLAVNPKDRFPNAHAIIAALDSRRLRQARRPLILLGVVGPIFGMLIVAIIGWMAFNSVIDDTQRTLIAKTRLSKRSDANFMRKAVEGQIVKRFHALEREAANPALKAALEAATGKPIGSPEQKKLQSWLAQFRQENNLKLDASPEDVWFINDRNGVQLARVPVDLKRETRGKNFSFRSYFHGGAKDAQRHRKMPPAKYVDAYLSPMFQNMARDKWVAPFSVCIWKGAPGESEVLGILTMTVQVGDFTELRSRRDEDGQLEFPILVDLNNGGLVLQHHELQRRRQDDPDARLRIFRLQDEEIDLIKSALGFGGDKPPADADQRKLQWSDKRWMNEIRDPVNLQKPDSYSGPWLAWFEPIVIRGKPSGLVVIAQESGEKLLKPVEELKTKLGWLGLYALGLMVAFITMLWSFVAIVLNDSPRSRLARAFRRRIGLPSSSLALPSGTVSLTGTVGQTNRTDGTADKGI